MKKKIHQKVKSNKFTTFGIMAFFAVTGMFYILLSSAATPGTPSFGLYVSPWNSSVNVGSEFSVSVRANLSTYSDIQDVTAFLRYDPSQLQMISADQSGVTGMPVLLTCSPPDGCQAPGQVSFTAGKIGSGTITPVDDMLVGNLRFKALKSGTAALTFDENASLSGFLKVDSTWYSNRQLLNGQYSLVAPGGGGTTNPPPATGGGTTTNNTANGGTAKTGTTTKTGTGSSGSGTTNTGNTTSPASPAETSPQNQATQNTPQAKPSDPAIVSTDAGDAPQKVSKPMIIVASIGLSALIVGTIMAAFSTPVRNAVLGVSHMLHPQHIQPAGHVMVGGVASHVVPTPPAVGQTPTTPVNPIEPISHLDPPKTTNTIPSHAGAPGKVIEPTQPPTEE